MSSYSSTSTSRLLAHLRWFDFCRMLVFPKTHRSAYFDMQVHFSTGSHLLQPLGLPNEDLHPLHEQAFPADRYLKEQLHYGHLSPANGQTHELPYFGCSLQEYCNSIPQHPRDRKFKLPSCLAGVYSGPRMPSAMFLIKSIM